ncbi:MAG TPA: cyclic nucleotide-binding domain-containing protein, partial [Gammaproteobacteria bacterium]|nr:cyclic nucleotide-binding domain-containing protein [Gammaproteobacteria bacterium]
MGAAQQTVAKDQIRKLVPFNGLSDAHFEEVIKKIIIKQLPSGKVLFKKGERDNQTCYVLSGEIDLLVGRSVKQKLHGDTEEAMHPLAPQQPRQFTAKSKTAVTILHIDSGLLDVMLTWDQSGEIEVNEIDTDSEINDDWMARMLQSELLLRLPALNIQQLIMRMESVEVAAGTPIVNQDDEGDYYYIIKKGNCVVTRKPSSNARVVKLAELHSGDSFGEESLLSGGKRNATITMATDGEIMRLSKKDFDELLKEPLLNQVDYDQAKAKISSGDRWLDVRLPGEYENSHIPGSINIPLAALRIEAESLDPEISYIVYCDTGRRSASASFLLGHHGINAFVLKNGIGAVSHEDLTAEKKSKSVQVDDGSADIIDFNKQRAQTDQQPAVLQDVEDADNDDREQALLQKEQHLQRVEAELVGRMAELDAQTESQEVLLQQDHSKVNEGLKAELERLTQRINSKSDELHAAITEKEKLASDLGRQEEIYAAQIVELENAHQGIEKESVHLRDELELLRTERADSKERLASLENELDTLKQELDIARASGESTKNALKSEYERLTDELEISRGKEQKHQDELTGYQQQKEELVRELEDIREKADSSMGDSQQRLDELQQDKDQLQSRLQDDQRQLDELREQLTQAQDQQSSISSVQLQTEAEHKTVLETVNQELTILGEQAGQLQNELNALNDEKQGLVQQLNEANSRYAAANDELEQLRTDLAGANDRRDSLYGELEALRSDKDRVLESKQSELSDIEATLQQTQQELDSLKSGSQQETGQLQETISRLEQDKESLKQELDKTVQHSEAVLATVSAEKDLVVAQSTELQQRLTNMESDLHVQLEKHEAQAQGLRSGIETEKNSLDMARTEVLQLQARLTETESKHEREMGSARAQLEEVRTGLKTRLADAKASHERQILRMQEDQEGTGAELKTLESKFRAMRGERDSAIDLRAAVEQELETLRKRYDSMRNEVGSIQTDKKDTSEIEREREALSKDKRALETELASLREQLESSGESDPKLLADKDSEINHLRRDVERLMDEQKYAEQERESALNEIKELQATTDDTATNHEQMESKLAELHSARDTLENRYSELEQEHDELKQLYVQQDSKLKSADISMQDTRTQVERYEQQLATLEERRDEMSAQLGAMQIQRDELQQQLIKEQSGGQSANRSLQDQLGHLQTEYNNLQQHVVQNKRESDAHEQAMQAQESANQSLEQKLAEQERHTQALQQELSKLSIQSDDQIRQLQELDKELEAKQRQITSLQSSHGDAEDLQQNTEKLTQSIESLEAVNSQTQSRLESLQASAA